MRSSSLGGAAREAPLLEDPRLVRSIVDDRLVLAVLTLYLLASRLIADVFVFPVGFSLQPADVLLMTLLGVWVIWRIGHPLPFPAGVVGVLGACVVVVVLTAPFINAGSMSAFEANGAERGLVRGPLLAGLFVVAYHLGFDRGTAYKLLRLILGLTLAQAAIALYETMTGAPFGLLPALWQAIGLEADPRGARPVWQSLDARLTGELRAAATAPHPLVLAGLLTIGLGISLVMYFHSDTRRQRRRYVAAVLIQLVSIGAVNQRTGFLALALVVLVIALTNIPRLPTALPLLLWSAVGTLIIALISPNTPRLVLNFFTGQSTDHNYAVRVSKYDLVPVLLGRRPVLGAGFLTSDPSVVIFDNAYLTALVELGILGTALLLFFLAAVAGRSIAMLTASPETDRPIFMAAIVAALTLFVTMATFDVLSFAQLFPTSLILMALGAARADVHRRQAILTSVRG